MEKSRVTVADQAPSLASTSNDGTRAPRTEPHIANALDELRALKDSHEQLHRLLAAHERLARLALDGGGFALLAGALSELAGNPVLIESRYFKSLAHASPAASPREDRPVSLRVLRKDPAAHETWSRLHNEREAALLPAPRDRSKSGARVAAPIHVRDDVVGYVSIVERDRPLESIDLALAHQAALTAAIAFVQQQAMIDVELRFKGDALDLVLQGADAPPETRAMRSALLGFDAGAPQTLLVVSPVCADVDRPSSLRDLATIVSSWARRQAPGSLVAERDGDVVVLLSGDLAKPRLRSRRAGGDRLTRPGSSGDPEVDLDPAQAELASSLRREVAGYLPNLTLSVVIAPPVRDARELREVYAAARKTLSILSLLGQRGRSISTSDPRLAVFLLFDSTRPETRQEFVDLVLGPLIAYDRRGHRRLVDTLESYLIHGGNLETTARALDVHTSTLKYRLQRIAEVSGIDVHNADHRFNAGLALRLRALDGGRSATEGEAYRPPTSDSHLP